MHAEHRRRTALRLGAATTALAGLAVAAAAAPASGAQASPRAPYGYTTRMVFDKNPSDPTNSRLYWRVYRVEDSGRQRMVVNASWRAGSGIGVKDDCASNRGWLPNGSYDVTLYTAYNGSAIKGVAFRLSDKRCHNGTGRWRTELFVHSEMTRTGGQNSRVESQRWDGNGDYRSNGCIKLKPADVKALASYFQKYHRAGTRVAGKLTVVS
ncbi:hypothetical protein [Streptomyces sp. NPDC001380]|uniref:hypothetical protein n=1 Tax=Streptomyces sp. NPDC001380 TaxID=3364566 RepID=UPI003696CECF